MASITVSTFVKSPVIQKSGRQKSGHIDTGWDGLYFVLPIVKKMAPRRTKYRPSPKEEDVVSVRLFT